MSAPTTETDGPRYDKKNPFPAPLLRKFNLNGEGSAKETIHAEISLEGSGLSYEAGDALGVVPLNDSQLVVDFLASTGLAGSESISVGDEEVISFEAALVSRFDLRVVTKLVLKKYATASSNDELLEKANNSDWVKEYAWGRDWVDVVNDYGPNVLTAQDFAGFLRPLAPRLYSIASSIKAHENEVHLTVGSVRYETHGRAKKGVCSTFIADMWKEGETAGVYFHSNKNFKLPQDLNTNIIMVGPGTGIAPFRAFIEERKATGAKGKNWLFFGDQHEKCDYLYQDEWNEYTEAGLLHKVDLAFSRDQDHKIYVQDRIRENGKELWEWIDQGAYFYVCGDASRMAKDVHQALIDVIAEHGGKEEADATAYLKAMQKEKRYARDVY